ncbi:hypothetical protein D3C79_885250 [compost metagenome]
MTGCGAFSYAAILRSTNPDPLCAAVSGVTADHNVKFARLEDQLIVLTVEHQHVPGDLKGDRLFLMRGKQQLAEALQLFDRAYNTCADIADIELDGFFAGDV